MFFLPSFKFICNTAVENGKKEEKICHFTLKFSFVGTKIDDVISTVKFRSAKALLPLDKYDMCRVVEKIVCVHDVK